MRTSRLTVVLLCAGVVLAACSSKHVAADSATGEGWAPFPVVEGVGVGQELTQYYSPQPRSEEQYRICAVLPALASPLLPVPSTTKAIAFGIADQARRQNVVVRTFTASTNALQAQRLKSCKANADALIVYWVDSSEAGLAGVVPTERELGNEELIVVGAPSGSYAATHSSRVVADPELGEAVAGAQWALGDSGGVPGTVVVLPGAATDAKGHPTNARAIASLVTSTLSTTALKVVGTYYGPNDLESQRKLVVKAMSEHPGLTYVIGTATAAQSAGWIFESMNTDRRPRAVSLGITPTVDELARSAAIAGAMSGSPVIQGRIALDQAAKAAREAPFLMLYSVNIAPVPVPIDSTNVNTSPSDWWQAPAPGKTSE